MWADDIIDKLRALQGGDSFEVKVVDFRGNILDIESIEVTPLNGGQIHVKVSEPDDEGGWNDE